MAYQGKPNSKPFELKPRTGSMFKNPDFNPNGDLDDPKNYWGNGTYKETNGTELKFTAYAKVAKSGKGWFKLSMYEPKDQSNNDDLPF